MLFMDALQYYDTHTVHFSVTHYPMLTIANISKLCTYLGRFITAIHDECAPIRCIRLQTLELDKCPS